VTEPPFGLSEEQAEAMIGTTNVYLTACPGSGKTRSVAARTAWLQEQQKRVALLSYTRVGASEIARKVEELHGIKLGRESYVGTLHSFLGRYVLRAFGHLVTRSAQPVVMNHDAVTRRHYPGMDARNYVFDTDGSVHAKKPKHDSSSAMLEAIKDFKTETAAAGLVNYDDALYWSYRVLNDHPDLADAVVRRFDEILIDEAQDCSPLQVACLRALVEAGLTSLVLVGDFDQSIYGFQGAAPQLCESLAEDANLGQHPLKENYRSSQLICDLSARFRRVSEPDKAVGLDADCATPPLLILYATNDTPALKQRFTEILDGLDEGAASSVILARNKRLAAAIRGHDFRWLPDWAETLIAARNAGETVGLETVKKIEDLLLGHAAERLPADSWSIKGDVVRAAAMGLATKLSELEGDMQQWLNQSRQLLLAAIAELAPAIASATIQLAAPTGFDEIDATIYVETDDAQHRVESVHAVKGESVDAVMLVAEEPDADWKTPQASDWARMLDEAMTPTEEIRIFYVAVTRARRVLVLALPDSTPQLIIDKYVIAGFQLQSE